MSVPEFVPCTSKDKRIIITKICSWNKVFTEATEIANVKRSGDDTIAKSGCNAGAAAVVCEPIGGLSSFEIF